MKIKKEPFMNDRVVTSKSRTQEIASLRKENEENKKRVEELSKQRDNLQQQLKLKSKAVLEQKQRNESLESRIEDLEEIVDAIRALLDRNTVLDKTEDALKTPQRGQDVLSGSSLKKVVRGDDAVLPPCEEFQDSPQTFRTSVGNTNKSKKDEEREVPWSLASNAQVPMAEKENGGANANASIWNGHIQPCEPGLDSKEFREFLKRRRKQQDERPKFKFVDVVRKQQDRDRLEAFECADCKAFYAHLNAEERQFACQHHRTPQNAGDKIRGEAGRHRATYKPPRTPPGFWDLDFPDSIERKKRSQQEMESSPF